MIFNEKEILFGESNKLEKQEKWIELFIKLNAMGANIPDYKVRHFFNSESKQHS